MKKNIIAIVNQKGGVGKTTTVINIAHYLASIDKKVLIIDLDPQGNVTGGLGQVNKNSNKTSYQLVMGLKNLLECTIILKNRPNLSLIPSDSNLSGAEVELVAKQSREYFLKNQLLDTDYDYILIDCPPSLGLLTINALTAANSVIIPVQTEYYALEGLSQLLATYQAIKNSTNPQLEITGVLLTMYDKRTTLSNNVRNEIKQYFKELVFDTTIPRNVRLAEAPSFGKTIFEHDRWSRGAKAYKNLGKEVVKRTS